MKETRREIVDDSVFEWIERGRKLISWFVVAQGVSCPLMQSKFFIPQCLSGESWKNHLMRPCLVCDLSTTQKCTNIYINGSVFTNKRLVEIFTNKIWSSLKDGRSASKGLVNSSRVYIAAVKQSTDLHQARLGLQNPDKALIPAIKYWFRIYHSLSPSSSYDDSTLYIRRRLRRPGGFTY